MQILEADMASGCKGTSFGVKDVLRPGRGWSSDNRGAKKLVKAQRSHRIRQIGKKAAQGEIE